MDEARVRRVKVRAWRRGLREADLILGPFADRRAASMTEAELSDFERLLEVPDHDLYAWIVESVSAPADLEGAILAALRESARAGMTARGG